MKTISNRIIRKFKPCYDPSEVVADESEELTVIEWVNKYRDKVYNKSDIIWLLCNKHFMTDKDMRLFAVWCAREALKLVDNPDARSINACDVAERYANGEATEEELSDAWADAWDAAQDAAFWAARDAARAAAFWAARAASQAAAQDDAQDAQIDKLLTYFK